MTDQAPDKATYRPKLLRASLSWGAMLKRISLKPEDVAARAHLPPTVFTYANSKITPDQYVRIWRAVEELHNDEYMGLTFSRSALHDVINLSVCALLFSKNMSDAINKLNDFQALITPAHFSCEENEQETTIYITPDIPLENAPLSLIYSMIVFLVELIRTCTGERIIPNKVLLNTGGERKPRYIDYFGVEPEHSSSISLTVSREDMDKPFLSNNEQLWAFFEPLLKRRMELLDQSTRYSGRVKGYLFERLASGQCDIKSVAEHFSMTSRTLQRRLFEEGTSFRKILDETRSEMAFVYLSSTNLAAYEISFLLGFEDKNSFFRAFHRWTGTTPQAARTALEGRKNYFS